MAIETKKQLYKSTYYRILTGVGAGVADYLGVPQVVIRLLFILLTFASGIGLVFYLALSVLLPTEEQVSKQEDLAFYQTAIQGMQTNNTVKATKKTTFFDELLMAPNIVAISILFFGAVVLQFDIVPWALIPGPWRYPALFITIGIAFILKSLTHKKPNIL